MFMESELWESLIVTPDFTTDRLKSAQFFAYLEVMTNLADEPYWLHDTYGKNPIKICQILIDNLQIALSDNIRTLLAALEILL
jgi:hypothetical protein